jgi:phosphoribosylformylglycinamidine synthase
MVPNFKDKVEMALAPNINPFVSGYYCTWVNIKNELKNNNCAFTKSIDENQVIPMPIAHGEGRFTTKDKDLLKKLIDNKQIIFRYCDNEGKIEDKFPINPNSSMYNIAGICNKQGNVLAMMPHPERASYIRQLPELTKKIKSNGNFNEMEKHALGMKIFESMKLYIEEKLL